MIRIEIVLEAVFVPVHPERYCLMIKSSYLFPELRKCSAVLRSLAIGSLDCRRPRHLLSSAYQ